jgi:hypothetical protein
MTYEEAMSAVRNNVASPPERASRGGGTAARRAAWADDPERRYRGVILRDRELCLNWFGSGDPTEWGLDVDASPWNPPGEDLKAADWEIHELWS